MKYGRRRGKITLHGAPCKRGHGTLRYASNRRCVICAQEDYEREKREKEDAEAKKESLA